MEKKAVGFANENSLKQYLHDNYMAQFKNFFGDPSEAMKFLSSVMAAVQKNPELLECKPMTVVNSFMTMAQLRLMPSDISGEAYVLPYNKNVQIYENEKPVWIKVKEAQFQLGYQGIITLLYRAGIQSIRSEIVRENDKFSFVNGVIHHEIDIFKSNKERGKAIGAYAIGILASGEQIAKAMNSADIMKFGENFSKSFASKHTPWDEKNDPELWMWKKTVLKQLAKLLPKNEALHIAVAADNEDSRISDIKKKVENSGLQLGALSKPEIYGSEKNSEEANKTEDKENQDGFGENAGTDQIS